MKLYQSTLASPLGGILLITDDRHKVRALDFADHRSRMHRLLREHYGGFELSDAPVPPVISAALGHYFDGDLGALHEIATETAGSERQRKVWAALRSIPAGRTMSYGELARTLGFQEPRAAIDMGAVNGANPVSIIVPCHRVIGSDGGLRGYAGGLHRKQWLLEHEGALPRTAKALRLPGF